MQTGLSLLLIGMVTVFSVLSIVVLTGRLLIFSLNRGKPEPVTHSPHVRTKDESAQVSARKLAAIAIATQLVTEGNARIQTVQRIEA